MVRHQGRRDIARWDGPVHQFDALAEVGHLDEGDWQRRFGKIPTNQAVIFIMLRCQRPRIRVR